MPVPSRYLKGFGISRGMTLAGYKLTHVHVEHVTVKRYHQYAYPSVFIFTLQSGHSSNPEGLLSAFRSRFGSNKTIYTSYHNPYKCNIGDPQIGTKSLNQVQIVCRGTCKRIYK